LPGKSIEAERVQDALKVLQTDLNNLYVDQGTYQSKLDELNKSQVEYDRLKEELAPLAKELVRWQTLIKAFGKSGIPALIIENSIPELERISNDILSQMTNGQNSLRFDTQRDKKDGKGQIETLDIWVNDDSGYERIYETYSGGEALRIDLAIRLGLAEFLASRSGSKIEFTVMDEVLSSQDSEHRQMVIDAIKAVAGRFKKVLMITHIETARAMFDQQIVMSEGGQVDIQFN
jgi:exonuclease SbcC